MVKKVEVERRTRSVRNYVVHFLLIISLLLFAGCDLLEDLEGASSTGASDVTPIHELTETDNFRPEALEHILKGEINRNGQAVGYHYEGLPDAEGEVIKGSESPTNENGVYEAKVKVNDTEKESNQGKSTFFPEGWDTQDVVDAINEAYDHRTHTNGNTYEGLTEEGIVVRMYLDDDQKIISAFPQK